MLWCLEFAEARHWVEAYVENNRWIYWASSVHFYIRLEISIIKCFCSS